MVRTRIEDKKEGIRTTIENVKEDVTTRIENFKEDVSGKAVTVQADSPTGIKETPNILLVAATKEQMIKSSNMKNAYPQGKKYNREVNIDLPPD